MPRKTIACLILVTFLWAVCFPLISLGLADSPPLYFAALRSLIAGVGLLVPAFLLRRPLPGGAQVWLLLLGVGLGTTTLGFAGMFLAGGLVSPGLATVLANAQPLIAAVLAYLILRERLNRRCQLGLLLGFAGIVVIALPGFGPQGSASTSLGIQYVLLGALGVATGNVLLKRLARRVDLLMAIGWQFVLGAIPLLLFAARFEDVAQIDWSATFVLILATLALLGTSLAFGLWYWLLQRNELTRVNTFTLLTPVFALLIGFAFFAESLQPVEGVGIALTFVGLGWGSRS